MARHLRGLAPVLVLLFAAPAFADDVGEPSEDERLTFLESHNFSKKEARVRVQQLLDYWSTRYGLKRSWKGDVARIQGQVMGVPFDGEVIVNEHDVSAVTSDPGVLFRSAASDYVRQKLRKYLHPTYSEG